VAGVTSVMHTTSAVLDVREVSCATVETGACALCMEHPRQHNALQHASMLLCQEVQEASCALTCALSFLRIVDLLISFPKCGDCPEAVS
jgi:hypothetical protein